MLTPGTRLGSYEIQAALGAGGMGIVYRAYDVDLQRPVAIKVLSGSLADAAADARLLNEARSASALNHPHICTIHAVGKANDQSYIVMEYVAGRPLCELIPADGLPVAAAVRYAIQIAGALAHAHEQGIIHRDLKSANIAITPDSRVKVLDFGLAKRLRPESEALNALTRSRQSLTESGSISGTLAYMAPEILRGEPPAARSDIWALGVLLYEMATGAPPFAGRTGFELTAAILREPTPGMSARLPPALIAVIERCLAKEPAERYHRASEMQAALETCLLPHGPRAPATIVPEKACPQCRRPAPEEAVFCPACGAKLTVACAHCGAVNAAGHLFCARCGGPLTVQEQPPKRVPQSSPHAYIPKHLAERILESRSLLEGERKQVTVLQCHLADAAAVAERLGSAAMGEWLARFFELALDEVHRYEGTVNQMLGDGFMALFGAPLVHEDDARRAVLAALGIQRRLGALREGFATPAGPEGRMIVRIGLNTGPVIVGRIADNLRMDYTAVGETTQLAGLLQQIAEPGAILMSEATRRLVREDIRTERVDLQVRTKSGSLVAYKLIDVLERSQLESLTRRALAPLVGRERELRTLAELLAQVALGQGQVVGLVGEPGMGKSRLLYEFRRDAPATFLEGRCLSYGTSTPYLPLLDVLRSRCGIAEGDNPETAAAKLETELLASGMAADEAGVYLMDLLGVSGPVRLKPDATATGSVRLQADPVLSDLTPEAIKTRTSDALRQFLLEVSRKQPLVLLIEDLHWIDRTSEDFLGSLVEALIGSPILLVTTYRPGYRPPWIDRSYATQITLRPLAVQDSIRIVESIMKADTLSASVGSLSSLASLSGAIVGKAEGNPFFLEELARTVLERGQADQAIPDTVQGVLMARIDRLPETTKRLLQTASVLGREFSLRLLSGVWEAGSPIEPELVELRRLEFIFERAGVEEPFYVFKHALTQEVAYESLLTARRQAVHAAAARALEDLYADRLEEADSALAYHYARSELAGKAVTYLIRVADKAARVYANTEALAHLEQALVHLKRLPDSRERDRRFVDVTLRRGHSLYFLGRFRDSVDLLLQQQDRLEQLGEPSLAGPYYFWLAHMYSRLGDQPRAAETARRAIEEAEQSKDAATLGKAHGVLALEGHWSGQTASGIAHGREAVSLLERTGQHWWLGMAHFYVAMNHLLEGRFDAALAAGAEAAKVGRQIGDPRLQTYAAFWAGWARASRGEGQAAIDECQKGLDQAPDPVSRVYASLFLGNAYLEQGDAEAAATHLEPAVRELEGFGFPQWHGLAMVLLAEAHRLRGEAQRASQLGNRGLQLTTRSQYWFGVGFAQRVLGRIALADGALREAEERFTEALTTFTSIQAEFEAARTRLDLAAVGQIRGDAAARHLGDAYRAFKALDAAVYVARVEALARELGVDLAATRRAEM